MSRACSPCAQLHRFGTIIIIVSGFFFGAQIIYSDDEDLACKDFTRDFYRLVNIKSESTRSLRSLNEGTLRDDATCGHLTDSSSDDDDDAEAGDGEPNGRRLSSPTPSEAGREQVISCSSSDSDDLTLSTGHDPLPPPPPPLSILNGSTGGGGVGGGGGGGVGDRGSSLLEDVLSACHRNNICKSSATMDTIAPKSAWRRSNGWRRISGQYNVSDFPMACLNIFFLNDFFFSAFCRT